MLDTKPRQRRVGFAIGDAQQIVIKRLFFIRPGHDVGRPIMHIAYIPHMARVAAPEMPGRGFQERHLGARLGSANRRAQGRIAAAGDEHVAYIG